MQARTITGAGLVTGGGDLLASRVLEVLAASAADIRTGTATNMAATPKALADTFGLDIAALGDQLAVERSETDADLSALSYAFNAAINALQARTITGAGLATGGGDLLASRVLEVLAASAADIRTGTATNMAATPKALADTFGLDIAALGDQLAVERSETDADLSTLADAFNAAMNTLRSRTITGAGLVTGGGDLSNDRVLEVLAASAAEVEAGSDGMKAITPLALSGLPRLLSQNGYAKLPGLGGLIIQWGRFSAIANGTTTTLFPLAFPTVCFSVVAGGGAAGGNDSQDNPPVVVGSGIERSGFAVFSADDILTCRAHN